MFIPKLFRVEDPEIMKEFIRKNGFATIISSTEASPAATHIPLDLQTNKNGDPLLWGHVSKGNPHWKIIRSNPDVLAVFMSPVHTYISSSWYREPNAPTWNYMSVHVTGRAEILEGEKLWESVRRLTDKYEKGEKTPVSLDSLPPSVQKQMNGLVGFEIRISKMECAFKLSQNRSEKDLRNIIKQLNLRDDISSKLMAEVMQQEVLSKRAGK